MLPFIRRVPRGIVTAATLVVGGCGSDASYRDATSLDDLASIGLTEELRIGSVDDPDYGFSSIGSIDVSPDGRVFVVERQDRHIRVYAPDGNLLQTIGGPGQGPGEFERAPSMGVVGDTVWALDGFPQTRVSLFLRDGTLLGTRVIESVRVPIWGGRWGHVRASSMGADGYFWSVMNGISSSSRDPAPEVGASESVPIPRVRFSAEGEVVDTVGYDPGPPPGMASPNPSLNSTPAMVTGGGQQYLVPNPPDETPRWIAVADGRFVVHPPQPTTSEGVTTVTRIGLSGDTLYHRELHYEAVPYDDSELDAMAAGRLDNPLPGASFFGGGSTIDAGVDADETTITNRIRAAMDFPEYRIGVGGGFVDDDGRLWISRSDPPGSPGRMVLLDADGMPVGEVTLPEGAGFRWSSGETLYVSMTDDFDVPWLVRYRLDL